MAAAGFLRRPRTRGSRTVSLAVASLVIGLAAGLWGCTKKPSTSSPYRLHDDDRPGLVVGGVRLLGTVELPGTTPQGAELHELSGLAWDEAAGLLYAVSDRGHLHHLVPIFDGEWLASVNVTASHPLTDKDGPLVHEHRDAEGLHLDGEELVVSFEKRPRVMRFDKQGRALRTLDDEGGLSDLKRYDAENHALEAVTILDGHGVVVAPERDVPGHAKGVVPIWRQRDGAVIGLFRGGGKKRSAVVALEALDDGRVVVLEREYQPKQHRLRSRLYLASPSPAAAAARTPGAGLPDGGAPSPPSPPFWPIKRLVELDTKQGWRHDNYEGLTRHRGARFFLVTDDNGGDGQKTLLSYIELMALKGTLEQAPPAGQGANDGR